ncbi:uncharacterized protein PAN0_008c3657 [Moesziomyces antarcticus]|uniref:Uncharacterized protein n=2 Tax=Pseudozyma antarctica TaxID=84753 RepID=A0A5C3FQG1_PSEA2|nr:uncharacterized protein PAN0_008c3657 [Moesziomyces antarcticus]GAK65440.1 hypothetical protein PAN0_008c3657 [Moesziomyces antarcticus]SPO46450.1 uncharacterized protein PSANT_04136 [Moesziomyces antarcticus]
MSSSAVLTGIDSTCVTGNLSTALLSPYHHSSLILPGHPSNYHGIQAPIHGASSPSLVTGLAIPVIANGRRE